MLYLHNGPPALVTGMLSALLGGALFWAGIFPAWEDGTEFSCKQLGWFRSSLFHVIEL